MLNRNFSGSVTLTETYSACVEPAADLTADAIADAMLRDGAKFVRLDLTDEKAWYAFGETF